MNRVWMITGAGRGLGRAFAEEAVNKAIFSDQILSGSRVRKSYNVDNYTIGDCS